jgi:aquaporin Z
MKIQAYAAELVGTFLFLSIGYLSVAAAGAQAVPPLLVVPFAFPLGLLAAIYAFGHISGGHFNPAVTIALVLDRRTTPIDAVGYIVSQVVGALAAGALVLIAFDQATVAAGITAPNAEAGVTDIEAVLLEAVLTAGFLLVILTASKRAGAMAALAIPLTLVAIHFALAPLTGASVNPARSLGSAVLGGDMAAIWIYIVGPILGGVVGWAVYRGAEAIGEPAETT